MKIINEINNQISLTTDLAIQPTADDIQGSALVIYTPRAMIYKPYGLMIYTLWRDSDKVATPVSEANPHPLTPTPYILFYD